MKKCPNCDREAVRTEDWSCQWCGYPLMSGSYKRVSKTFRELKGERVPQRLVVQQPEPEPIPVGEPEPVQESGPEPVLETKPEPIPEPKPKPKRKPVAKRKTTAKSKTTTEAKARTPKATPEATAKAESTPKVETEAASADMELTVDELLDAYATGGEGADARFTNQILKMTGVAERIEIKDALDIYYITLNTAQEEKSMQSVRCVFDKKHAPELGRLETGQTMTVQGKYDGSVIDLSLRDCVLVG